MTAAGLKSLTHRDPDKLTAFDAWPSCVHPCVWCGQKIVHWKSRWRCRTECVECAAQRFGPIEVRRSRWRFRTG